MSMDIQGPPLSSLPDRDLVVAFKAGMPEAYDEMYRRYSDRVGHVCRKMLVSHDDALEATQETFMKAYLALPRFNGEYRLGAWLARIAGNVCVDHIRRQGRSASVIPLTEHHEGIKPEPGPEDAFTGDVRASRALEDMQPLHARALTLRGMQGMSHKEIADQLGMTPMQVKALLHRARASFKRAWDNASGWVLAPLAGMRSLLHSSRDPGSVGAQFSMWGPVTTPLFAEKMGASAMVVVIALSGASGGLTSTGSGSVPRAVAVADHRASSSYVHTAGTNRAAERPTTGLVAEVSKLVDEVRRTTDEKANRDRQGNRGRKGNEQGIDPTDPGRASTKVMRKVTKTVEDILPDH